MCEKLCEFNLTCILFACYLKLLPDPINNGLCYKSLGGIKTFKLFCLKIIMLRIMEHKLITTINSFWIFRYPLTIWWRANPSNINCLLACLILIFRNTFWSVLVHMDGNGMLFCMIRIVLLMHFNIMVSRVPFLW